MSGAIVRKPAAVRAATWWRHIADVSGKPWRRTTGMPRLPRILRSRARSPRCAPSGLVLIRSRLEHPADVHGLGMCARRKQAGELSHGAVRERARCRGAEEQSLQDGLLGRTDVARPGEVERRFIHLLHNIVAFLLEGSHT